MYTQDKEEQEIGFEALYCISVSSGATRKRPLVGLLMPSHSPQLQTCSPCVQFPAITPCVQFTAKEQEYEVYLILRHTLIRHKLWLQQEIELLMKIVFTRESPCPLTAFPILYCLGLKITTTVSFTKRTALVFGFLALLFLSSVRKAFSVH